MAKGFEAHQARMNVLSFLGKDLARRAKSKCELCETSGQSLAAYEVPPALSEPDVDHCIFICERCLTALDSPKKRLDAEEWRFLSNAIWSEVPAVVVVAVRMLRRLEKQGADWARELLEETYLEPDIQTWADEA